MFYHLFHTKQTQEWILVTESDILSIIKSLDSTKAHGSDNLSIRMKKMCTESITLPLKIIFPESLKKRDFQKYGKKQM